MGTVQVKRCCLRVDMAKKQGKVANAVAVFMSDPECGRTFYSCYQNAIDTSLRLQKRPRMPSPLKYAPGAVLPK